MGNFVMGAILLAIGIYLVVKAFYLNHQVFFLAWAERKWGAGSGTTAYKFIGLGTCILGMFTMIGWVDMYGSAFGGSSSAIGKSNTTQIKNNTQIYYPANYKNGDIAP